MFIKQIKNIISNNYAFDNGNTYGYIVCNVMSGA